MPASRFIRWFREIGIADVLLVGGKNASQADLTAIARKNGGPFPDGMVIEFIDSPRDVLAHGPRAMPVWSLVFQHRETIRKIVDYLRGLQQQ